MLAPKDVTLMRRVIMDPMSLAEIRALATRQQRVCAAVAHVLANPRGRIDTSCRVLISYNRLLEEVTGDTFAGNKMVGLSQRFGLHKSESPAEANLRIPGLNRIITLTPPLEILHLVNRSNVTPGDRRRAEELLRELTITEGIGVAEAMYDLLRRVFR